MTNTIEALKPTYWSKRYQAHLQARNISRVITSSKEEASLTSGKTVDRPYLSRAVISDLTLNNGTYTPAAMSATSETLTVNMWKASSINITKDQEKQVLRAPSVINRFIDDGAWRLNQYIDRATFAEYVNAAYSTTATEYSKTTIYDGIGEAHKTLRAAGVDQSVPWYLIGDADLTQLIQNSQGARETVLGDQRQKMGFGFNREYAGFRVYESAQALTMTSNIIMSTNPTANDTLVIDGVTFKFVAAPANPGEVDLGGTAAATIDNLVALITDPTTTTSGGVALSTADAAKFVDESGEALIAATDNATYMTLTSKKGRITLAETFTAAGNGIEDAILHCLAGQMGNIDTVFQSDLETMVNPNPQRTLSKDYVTDVLWGIKTFKEGGERMVDFQVKTMADTTA